MILQDIGRIPGWNIQDSLGILVGSWQEIQEVKRWVGGTKIVTPSSRVTPKFRDHRKGRADVRLLSDSTVMWQRHTELICSDVVVATEKSTKYNRQTSIYSSWRKLVRGCSSCDQNRALTTFHDRITGKMALKMKFWTLRATLSSKMRPIKLRKHLA